MNKKLAAIIATVVLAVIAAYAILTLNQENAGYTVKELETTQAEQKYVEKAVQKTSQNLNITEITLKDPETAEKLYNLSIASRLMQQAQKIAEGKHYTILKINEKYVLVALKNTTLYITESASLNTLQNLLQKLGIAD